jgi:hypothetical protein
MAGTDRRQGNQSGSPRTAEFSRTEPVHALVPWLIRHDRSQQQTFKVANEAIFGLENVLIIYLGAQAALAGDMTVGMLLDSILENRRQEEFNNRDS